MTAFLRASCILVMALATGACNLTTGNHPDALVVDIVAVAKALGRDEVMQKQLESTRDQLNQQLASITQDLSSQVKEKKAALGDKPSGDDEKALEEFTLKASQTLKQTQLLARQKALAYRNSLIEKFHDEVRTQAAAIARQRGASTVLMANESTLWFDPEADITDEVIARMRAEANETAADSSAARTTPSTDVEAGPTADTQDGTRPE